MESPLSQAIKGAASPFGSARELPGAPPADVPAPDLTPPSVFSATLAGDGLTLTVAHTEALDTGNDTTVGEWGVTASATIAAVSASGINPGSTSDVILTLDTAITSGETVSVNYSGASLRDTEGNQVISYAGQAVVNGSTQTDGSTVPLILVTDLSGRAIEDAGMPGTYWGHPEI